VSDAILVTGGAGSVGRMLVERFVEAGQQVRVFDLPQMDFSGLEGRDDVEVQKGDITSDDDVAAAVDGVGSAVHLAALLPPNSERDRDLTFRVNVGGTEKIVKALTETNPEAMLVFTSSISTYGDTAAENPPVTIDHAQSAIDIYADSKIAGERLLQESSLKNTVVLRIAGIAVPAFLEPPDPWPFMVDQRVEMVHRGDVVDALVAAARTAEAGGKVFNIGGGPTWQLHGCDYVRDFYDFMGAPADEAVYRDTPGWMDWYDTEESQRILGYQNRSYQHYSDEMRAIVEAMMAE
jgi:nucleoside-diphosphate-sugar epimerase|tara:strand:+ start:3337 stop:4215 length:879 start_codon:yes stop_codon:yes gene_type:complete